MEPAPPSTLTKYNNALAAIEAILDMLALEGLTMEQSGYLDLIRQNLCELRAISNELAFHGVAYTDQDLAHALFKVLLVDNDPVQQLMVSRALAFLDIVVFKALNADHALQALQEGEFSLIIIDCELPGRDGFDLVQDIRARSINSPILAYTAHGIAGYKERCLQVGMNEYLSKRKGTAALVDKVREMIGA